MALLRYQKVKHQAKTTGESYKKNFIKYVLCRILNFTYKM